jgi:hypothetical protein
MRVQLLKNQVVWTRCDCCEEYLCAIHLRHASECDCPSIDKWAETEWNPYFSKAAADVCAWVEDNPIDMES